jgi:predicted transglutaminase-like cysteine proteinase
MLALAVIFLLSVQADIGFKLDSKLLDEVEKKHGMLARKRLLRWQELITTDTSTTDLEKLTKVNDFFNQVQFVSDILLWKKTDYWATPVEFLAQDAGDCEDFSIAKYFTLKMLGVAEDKLNMTYVKALELDQAHMVVTYYETPEAEPLILDNLNPAILPAAQRSDLMPVFSFNGSGLWLAKQRQRGKMVGSSDRYKRWRDLLQRMPEGLN